MPDRKYKLIRPLPDDADFYGPEGRIEGELLIATFDDYDEASEAMEKLNAIEAPAIGCGYVVSWREDQA